MDNNQVPNTQQNTPAIIALVCGLVGLFGVWPGWFSIVALICSILGIVFGSKGMKQAKAVGSGNGLAVAGLVLGIIGAVLSFVGVVCWAVCAAAVGGHLY